MTKITYKQVEKTLREITAENPNRTAQCRYNLDGQPECIVGQAVYKINGDNFFFGMPEVGLFGEDGKPETSYKVFDGYELYELLRKAGYTYKALKLLSRVQRFQDRGYPWADAFDYTILTWDEPWDKAQLWGPDSVMP